MIKISNVTKKYKRYVIQYNTLKSFLLNYKTFREEDRKISELCVIENLNLVIQPSEFFCIVGNNGAGKSTLAKLIAGTIEPTKGSIEVVGRIVPFLELGVAFSAELTGRDNVMLNGVMIGLKRAFLRDKMQEIFEFAEVAEFIDTPVKYYSSGMMMRLAFSIGMHADGDIYIFDEILAVGDANFQKKCFESFQRLVDEKKTIILITHNLGMVSERADRVLYLENGKHKLITNESEIKSISLAAS